jgi:hypothetical protein
MIHHGHKLLPEESESSWCRVEFILDFWNQLRISDDTGMTTWDELVPLERKVVECLERSDLAQAESYTAKAMHLIAGHFDEH